MTYKEIAKKIGFSEKQIRGKIKNLGLTKKIKKDSMIFHTINDENSAYWLGFIYADGYVSENHTSGSYMLGIEIHKSDKEHLLKFRDFINPNVNISDRTREISFNGYNYTTNVSSIRIYSKKIVDNLKNQNIVPAKTYSLYFPKCDKFFWDFLRGVFDGDGCITSDGKCVKITNPNVKFLEYIKETIKEKIGIVGKIYKENEWKYNLVLTKKSDRILFLNHIYYDGCQTYLLRKYRLFQKLYGSPIQ